MFEEEVFEITDFTTSSDWERFISHFEEIIRQWDLSSKESKKSSLPILRKGSFTSGKWDERYEIIKFGKICFTLTHHSLIEEKPIKVLKQYEDNQNDDTHDGIAISLPIACCDMMSKDNDFPARAHCLVRYHGLREFIILSPAANTESITSEDRSKLLLSSACIALNNTNCSVPIFVQMHQRQRRYYHGVCQSDGLRVHFDMIHFRDIPGPYRYLSELLNLFKDKLQSSLSDNPPVMISIRFTHALREWPHGWSQEITEDSDYEETENESKNEEFSNSFRELPWNFSHEPILEFQLSTSWPSLSEEVIVDSAVHSDLDPLQAPLWSLRVIFKETIPLPLSDSLRSLLSLQKSRHSHDQIMGKLIADSQAEDSAIEIKHALSKLTNPSPLAVPLPQFHLSHKWNRPKWIKAQCLSYIFKQIEDNDCEFISDQFRSLKSAPYDSITWRIAMKICNVHSTYKELADVAHLWKEIICELRNHWESSLPLPRLPSEPPNLGMCLLHQKLQMINCCIEQKKAREMRQMETDGSKSKGDESDDEFYDASEEQISDIGIVATHAEGRLRQCGDLKLHNVNEALYIPITQEPPPMTEDLLQEQSRILSQLGTSSESAALRARMQCAGLLSDMEAFKAANPGAVIEDFIRWHSPRDWIQNDDTKGENKGQLSARMQSPGNMWHEVWESAKPIPAHRQKRLFDYTKEAEKVLHYFTSLTVNDLIELLIPIVIQSAVMQITQKRKEFGIQNDDIPFPRDAIIMHCNDSAFESSFNFIRDNEMKIHHFNSLQRKFDIAHDLEIGVQKPKNLDEVKKFVLKLMTDPEVDVPKAAYGHFGRLLKRMFQESQFALYEASTTVGERDPHEAQSSISKLPYPIAKEFIFRVSLPRPRSYSRQLPHRMYCLLSAGEFRLCGAFSEDTCFF